MSLLTECPDPPGKASPNNGESNGKENGQHVNQAPFGGMTGGISDYRVYVGVCRRKYIYIYT